MILAVGATVGRCAYARACACGFSTSGARIVLFAQEIRELKQRGRNVNVQRVLYSSDHWLTQQHVHVYQQTMSAMAAARGFSLNLC